MNKLVYIRQAILDLSKTLMYEFYYDYLQVKYNDRVKLCYIDTDSFIIRAETEEFYKDIANDVDKWFDTSCYSKDIDRPIPKGKNKKTMGMFKGELDGNVMNDSANVRAKLYSFTQENDDGSIIEKKKAKGTKKCITKKQLTHQDFQDAIFSNKTTKRKQLRFRSDHRYVFTEEINKTLISPNDDKRLQAHDGINTHQYGTPAVDVCKSQMLNDKKIK